LRIAGLVEASGAMLNLRDETLPVYARAASGVGAPQVERLYLHLDKERLTDLAL
jgi:hypothetical protein